MSERTRVLNRRKPIGFLAESGTFANFLKDNLNFINWYVFPDHSNLEQHLFESSIHFAVALIHVSHCDQETAVMNLHNQQVRVVVIARHPDDGVNDQLKAIYDRFSEAGIPLFHKDERRDHRQTFIANIRQALQAENPTTSPESTSTEPAS